MFLIGLLVRLGILMNFVSMYQRNNNEVIFSIDYIPQVRFSIKFHRLLVIISQNRHYN